MRERYLKLLFALVAVAMPLFAATQAIAQRYSGRASAVRTIVGAPLINPVITVVNDTGELASAGGNITLASANASIANANLTAGASSSSTRGGTPVGTSHSET